MEELVDWARQLWIQRCDAAEDECFSPTLTPNNGQGSSIFSGFVMLGLFMTHLISHSNKKNQTHPDSFSCCSAEVRWCAPADLCLHLYPYRINKAIFVCSKVKYTNLRCWGGTFSHLLLMFRPVESIMSILCSDKWYCRETPYHYFSVAVGVFLQQNIMCSE